MEHFQDPCAGIPQWLDGQTYYTVFTEGWGLYSENPVMSDDTDIYKDNLLQKYGMLKWQVGPLAHQPIPFEDNVFCPLLSAIPFGDSVFYPLLAAIPFEDSVFYPLLSPIPFGANMFYPLLAAITCEDNVFHPLLSPIPFGTNM